MKRIILALSLLATPAFAQQQQPDPAFLQRVLSTMQAQRNQATDALAVSDTRIAVLQEELEKIKARVKELEAPKEEKK